MMKVVVMGDETGGFQWMCAARIEELSVLLDEFIEWGQEKTGNRQAVLVVALALDELFMNSLCHGYRDNEENVIHVEASIQDSSIVLKYQDAAPLFDPTMIWEAEREHNQYNLEDRPIGGIGMKLVKALVDRAEYAKYNQKNSIVLHKVFRKASQ